MRIYFAVIFLLLVATSPALAAIKIMPLGDSITEGSASGVILDDSGHWISYRKALWDRLDAEGYDVDFVGSMTAGGAVFTDPEHEGHPGWRDNEIVDGNPLEPEAGKLIDWLQAHQPDIVLLHIGTNGVNPSPTDVEAILDVIDQYSTDVWVILARIINRHCKLENPPCQQSTDTTDFNDNVADMAQLRINGGDKIVPVDMELSLIHI